LPVADIKKYWDQGKNITHVGYSVHVTYI
jgi:hypothetical protein